MNENPLTFILELDSKNLFYYLLVLKSLFEGSSKWSAVAMRQRRICLCFKVNHVNKIKSLLQWIGDEAEGEDRYSWTKSFWLRSTSRVISSFSVLKICVSSRNLVHLHSALMAALWHLVANWTSRIHLRSNSAAHISPGEGVLPYIGCIGINGPKGCDISAVLIVSRVFISNGIGFCTLVLNWVCF